MMRLLCTHNYTEYEPHSDNRKTIKNKIMSLRAGENEGINKAAKAHV